jgi:hypothetical protein
VREGVLVGDVADKGPFEDEEDEVEDELDIKDIVESTE